MLQINNGAHPLDVLPHDVLADHIKESTLHHKVDDDENNSKGVQGCHVALRAAVFDWGSEHEVRVGILLRRHRHEVLQVCKRCGPSENRGGGAALNTGSLLVQSAIGW